MINYMNKCIKILRKKKREQNQQVLSKIKSKSLMVNNK